MKNVFFFQGCLCICLFVFSLFFLYSMANKVQPFLLSISFCRTQLDGLSHLGCISANQKAIKGLCHSNEWLRIILRKQRHALLPRKKAQVGKSSFLFKNKLFEKKNPQILKSSFAIKNEIHCICYCFDHLCYDIGSFCASCKLFQ